jgi:iron complex transport system ATP-binding protein
MLQAAGVSFSYGRARKPRAAARSTADDPARIQSRAEHTAHQRAVRHDVVLDDVCLSVERGELVGILGPNGSGKTTLLKLLGGMHRPTIGAVTLDGRPLAEWSHRQIARRIAFVPQETQAPFDFSVLDIVLMGRFPHLGAFALEGPEDLAIARRALAATGTGQFEGRAFSTLSGGEKQRVVIAGALAQSTQLLLLDEPTASLDIGHQIEVQMLLQQLNANQGVTMLLSTHDLNLAAALCRRLVLLIDGRVLASGPTEEVLTPPAVQELYGVEADIARHPATGHLTVVPIRRG